MSLSTGLRTPLNGPIVGPLSELQLSHIKSSSSSSILIGPCIGCHYLVIEIVDVLRCDLSPHSERKRPVTKSMISYGMASCTACRNLTPLSSTAGHILSLPLIPKSTNYILVPKANVNKDKKIIRWANKNHHSGQSLQR